LRHPLLAFIFGLFLSVLLAGAALVKAQEPTRWFANTIAQWDRILDETEAYLASDVQTERQTEDYRILVESVRTLATSIKRQAAAELATVEPLLAALGPPPEPGAQDETQDVAERRRKYTERIASLRSQIAEADLALARIDLIEQSVSAVARDRLLRELTTRHPWPVAPDVIAKAVPEFFEVLGVLARSPAEWHAGLSPEEQARVRFRELPTALAVAFIVALIARRILLRRLGPVSTATRPSYGRRLGAAIAVAAAKGLFPAAIVAGLWGLIHRPGALISGQFLALADGLLGATLFFILAYTIPRAVLALDDPTWRLTNLDPDNARKIYRRFTALAAIAAVDIVLGVSTRGLEGSPQLVSVYLFVVSAIEVPLMVSLAPGYLWQRVSDETAAEAEKKQPSGRFWRFVRRGVAGALVLALAIMIPGYIGAGRYIVEQTLFSSMIIVVPLVLARGLLRDLVGIFTRSALARRRMHFSPRSLQATKFWVRAIFDPLLLLTGILLLAPYWGIPREDLARWTVAATEGFTIGTVTISPVDIILAIVVFFAVMALTRLTQRGLQDRVLPQTRITESAGHSIVAVLGYVGVVIAFAVAIAVAGVDLTNIAIVVGALSVGIGFGLQNMVNNFVSGLILLVERPIKVGDWVVVGGLEGFVKRVNFRATEIETWQRAAVIMPNAEILSNPVTNWTHRDRHGRIEIPVGVAYGSDVEKVREILLACAKEEALVIAYPAPFVLFREFGESNLDFEFRCYTNDVLNRLVIGSNLRFEIDRRFREEGIEIPFPQRVVHFPPVQADTNVPNPAGGEPSETSEPDTPRSQPEG